MVPFNYHHLYYFYSIAEEGSVTQAARKLRLSQSSLSMQLSQFESFLDKKLFVREGKRLVLTEDGAHILSYAKTIFDLGEELADSLSDRTKQGHLSIQIGVSGSVPKSFVDSLLKYLLELGSIGYINLIERDLSDMIPDLMVHKLDMLLSDTAFQAPAEHGIENHLIASIPVTLCGTDKLTRKIKRLPNDLEKVPLILPTAHSQTYHALQEYFLSKNIKPNVIAEIQDLELVRRLVLAGKAVAPINELTIKRGPGREKIKMIGKGKLPSIRDSIYLIKKYRRQPHPLVLQLLKGFRI